MRLITGDFILIALTLQKWGEYNNFEPQVLEHYTNSEKVETFGIFLVTVKNKKFSNKYPNRIIKRRKILLMGEKTPVK